MKCMQNALIALFLAGFTLVGCNGDGKPQDPSPGGGADKKLAGKAESESGPEVDLASLPAKPVVLMKTSAGDLKIELEKEKAPITVKNFLTYVKSGFYEGTLFHRIAPKFVIQCGGFTEDLYENPAKADKKATRPPIKNEADNGLKNLKYSLSMARFNAKDTATSQFFINLKDNTALDHRDESRFGYAVFGRVIDGKEVVDRIGAMETRTLPPRFSKKEVPVEPVVVLSVSLLDEG